MKPAVYKLPEKFIEKLQKIYPSGYTRICDTFLVKRGHTFRVNNLKTNIPGLKDELNREGIKYRDLHWPPGSFALNSEMREFQKSRVYTEGLVYVQNISSMIPPIVLAPKEGEKILDICAAPGAKTTQLASMTGPGAEIIAVEKIDVRYYKLLANLKMQGADFVKPSMMNGIAAKSKYPAYFDKILADVQCSCEARFYIPEPKTFGYWKDRKVKEMSYKQKRLLSSSICCLKEGGEIVYSTCTFSPEENEAVIDWALNKFSGMSLVPIDIPVKNTVRGFTSWEGKKFSPNMRYALRILPNELMEGFFIAKLKKSA